MDKIFNKIIKYGGTWSKNVFSLASSIQPDAETISVNYGSEKLNLIDGDILRLEIASSNFIVEYSQSAPNTLKILSTDASAEISQLEPISTLVHLQSSSPEDVPSNFELNRISKRTESSPEVHIIKAPTDATEGQINVSNIRKNRNFMMKLIEMNGSEVYDSELQILDNSSFIRWYSLTTIPNGFFVIEFLPN